MTDDILTAEVAPTRRAQAKAERRLTLIEATIDSIAEYGLSGTTLARVTEIAGTSIGLANFYFENKERLFESVLVHLAEIERTVLHDHLGRVASAPDESPADHLLALVDARFDPAVCNPRTLAVWFAFWGDAGARQIYRRMVEATDDARLQATVDLIGHLTGSPAATAERAEQTALGLEAFYDGLWLNLLLYPAEFPRVLCRQRAVEHLVALFPAHFPSQQAGAAKDQIHGP